MENGYKNSCSCCCSNSRIHKDFVPSSEIVHGKDYDTLLLYIPGFRAEEVKVQLCKTGIVKISGERAVNNSLSFQKEIHVSRNCDKSKINARLVNGILYVKHPKVIKSSQENEKEFAAEEDHKKIDEISKQDDDAPQTPRKEKEANKAKACSTSDQQPQVKQDDDETMPTASDLFGKLKVSRQVMNMALAALVVLGIGRYVVVNVMRSPKKPN